MSSSYNALAAAIMQEENSQWPNNPGAIESASGQPINFGSYQAGQNALLQKLQYDLSGQSGVYSPNMTLSQFENVYTGGDPNAATNIGSMLGVSTSTPMSQLSDQNLTPSSNPITRFWNWLNQPSAANQAGVYPIDPMSPISVGTNPASNVPQSARVDIGGPNSAYAPSQGSALFANIAAVLVGLVLIAGAVFTFSQVKETVVSAAKTVAA